YAALATRRFALFWPASNSGMVNDGPTDQNRLDQLNNVPAFNDSNPARPLIWTVGKNAAFATPMLALAAAMRRSAAATSGRRSSNSDGNPGGMTGGCASSGRSATVNEDAGTP